jgi:dolichol kinase
MVFLSKIIRALKFEYFGIRFGELIDSVIARFRDHQDEGKLVLTPTYLLVGCSLPIWLTGLYAENGNVVLSAETIAAALSGVLSIGIGDTFASIGGSMYGKTAWPGTVLV